MSISFDDCQFDNIGKIISTYANDPVDCAFRGSKIANVRLVFERRDPKAKDLCALMGLPRNSPDEAVLELIQTIYAAQPRTVKQAEAALKQTKLWDWLSRLANATTVVRTLIQCNEAGLLAQFFGVKD